MSGTFATIFSFEKSRKWIIREGLKGISLARLGRVDREGLEEVSWVTQVVSPGSLAVARALNGTVCRAQKSFP